MILVCSRGCKFDTTRPFSGRLKPGDRCPMVLSYDRMRGSTYCRRILREEEEQLMVLEKMRSFLAEHPCLPMSEEQVRMALGSSPSGSMEGDRAGTGA